MSVNSLLTRLAMTIILASLGLTSQFARAQDSISPDHLAAAKETVLAIGASRQMELVMPIMLNQMERTYAQLKPELSDKVSQVLNSLRPKFNARLSTFTDKMAKAYANEFTVEQLKTITTFYASEAGKKFVSRERDLERSNARIGREFSEQLGREIDIEIRAEMKKRGHDF